MKTETKNKKNNSKKGFTLIELLAVIVILGILMIVAIPAVTRYIEASRKKAYIKTVNSLVDTVRYGITSGNSKYSMNGATTKKFDLTEVETENGKNTIIEGSLTVNIKTHTYRVIITKEKNNYCLSTDASDLSEAKIHDCNKDYEYEIGDDVWFADSNWKVIKKSKFDDDYVALLKEKVLTNAELGIYAYGDGYDTMAFGNNNIYSTSNMKSALQAYMQTKNIVNDLVEDENNYKIRLVTTDELVNNLGWTSGQYTSATTSGNNVPTWVYSNFGENQNNVLGYWTMTPKSDGTSRVFYVNFNLQLNNTRASRDNENGVRPVINLLKTSIE